MSDIKKGTEITIGISKRPITGEFVVFWKEGNKTYENKAYYTDDPLDAVNTLESILSANQKVGRNIKVSTGSTTETLIRKYGGSGKPQYICPSCSGQTRGQMVPGYSEAFTVCPTCSVGTSNNPEGAPMFHLDANRKIEHLNDVKSLGNTWRERYQG